jgi:aminobenzoyl-glutamate transport protein
MSSPSEPALAPGPAEQKPGMMERILGAIERGGNKMPNPAILFVWLCVGVILLSAVLSWADIRVTYQVAKPPPIAVNEVVQGGSTQPSGGLPDASVQEGEYEIVQQTASIESLISVDGVRFMFTSFVASFRNFAAVAIILVVMIGVGLAEAAGLIGSLIRKLVSVTSPAALTPIIIFIGVLSSVASDAGYLVLIPLGAAAFKSVGRNPLAGIAAAFAGVAAGFGVNFLITPLDGVLTEITNDAIALSDPNRSIDLAANLYFGIASTILVTLVASLVSAFIVERSLGRHDPARESRDAALDADQEVEVSPELEAKGLRSALLATTAVVIGIALLTVFPGAPLRDPVTGDIIGNSPFMDSLIVIITMIFFAAGLAYGHGAGTLKGSDAVLGAISKSWAGLASLLFLFLLIAQFIAYFNYSNMATVAAVKLGDWLEEANIGAVWLLIGFILIAILVDFIMPAAIAKWAILAPIFIPLFLRLDISPQTVLAAYRVGDSPANVITPLMAYFPLIVIFTQRYRKDAGIGTVISMMLPYVIVLSVIWTAFFVVWYLIGIPLGPGSPIHLH